MKDNKQDFLSALERSLGVVSSAARATGTSRVTHWRWMNQDKDYAESVRQIEESAIDFGESHLHKLIKEGNPAATIFFLKTKGKNRGYVERQEVAQIEKKPLSWFE